MGLPLVGAHAVLTGVPEFESASNKVNNAVGGIHRNFVGLTAGAEGFGLSFGRAFSGVETALLGVAAIGAKVGKSLIKDVFDAGPIANIERVYHNMTKNFGIDSEKLMLQLRAASYGAVDDFELMQKANLSMIGSGKEFGKFFAESLPKLMKISRESAKAQGVAVDYAFNSVAVGIKRMSPMILDNLGFQISLTEATEKYAAAIGKTSKELTKEEKQIAVLNEVLSQGDALIESTGGHMDNVQTTWIAWGTAISNARKRFAIELLPIMQKFMDMLGTPSGDALSGKAVQFGKAITGVVLPALDSLFMIIGAIVNGPLMLLIKGLASLGFEGIQTIANEIGKVFSGEGIQTGKLSELFKTAFGGVLGTDLAGEIGRRFGEALQTVQSIAQPVIEFIRNGVASIQQIFENAGSAGASFFDGLSKTFSSLWEVAQPVITGIGDLIRNYFVSSFENAKRLISDLQPTFQAVFDYLSGIFTIFVNDVLPLLIDAFGGVVDWVNAHWPEIQSVIQTVIDAVSGVINWFATNILPFIVENFKKIVDWVKENWPLIKQTIETVLNAIWGVVKRVLDAIKRFWDDHGAAIKYVVETVWGAIKTIIETVMTLIGGVIKAIMQAINGDWDGAWQTIKTTVENVWNGIVKFIEGIIMAVLALINEFLIQPLTKMWNDFWTGVGNVVRNIWNGIVKFLQDIINTAIGVINGLIDSFNNTIGKVTGEIPKLSEVAWTTEKELSAAGVSMGQAMQNTSDTMLKAFNTMKTGIASASQGIADPMVKQFDSAKQRIVDIMNEIMKSIEGALKRATGIELNMPSIPSPATGGSGSGGSGSGGNSQPSCFLSGTSIMMADGRQMPIELVRPGMQVAAYDLCHDNQYVVATVKRVMSRLVHRYYFIQLSDGTSLDVTGEHPLYAPNLDRPTACPHIGFVMVRDLEIGDELWVFDGTVAKPVTLREKREEFRDEEMVYNLSVEPYQTYFANMVLVHNKQQLARGAILGGPTYLAGEAGSEVVAPLSDLSNMIREAMYSVLALRAEAAASAYSKPASTINQRGGDTYYQLTMNSVARPGTTAMEFKAMELAHL